MVGSVLAAADWPALGSTVRLVVDDPARLTEARRLLAEDLDALDLACSRFRADSELVLLQQRAAGQAAQVSPLLREAIEVALAAAAQTGGDLDPTLAAPLAALGYDRDFALLDTVDPALPAPMRGSAGATGETEGSRPDRSAPVVRVRSTPTWQQVAVDRGRGMVHIPAGVSLDLGATAKAWAADRAAARIVESVGGAALVSLGGDIAVAGPAPEGGWQIRVQDVTGHPEEPACGPVTQLGLNSGGLATSSTTARRWRHGRDVLHHILDPRTGAPADGPWRTVTVAAGSALAANVASTTAIIRGAGAQAWLARLGLPARLVHRDGWVRLLPGWPSEVAA